MPQAANHCHQRSLLHSPSLKALALALADALADPPPRLDALALALALALASPSPPDALARAEAEAKASEQAGRGGVAARNRRMVRQEETATGCGSVVVIPDARYHPAIVVCKVRFTCSTEIGF